jgi:STE24 endopeptidase
MYLVVIGITSLVLAFTRAPYPLLGSPQWTIVAVLVAALLPPAAAWLLCRVVLATLERYPNEPARGQHELGRGMFGIQWLLAAAHGGVLLFTEWLSLCARVPQVGKWPLVPGLLACAPLLVSIVLVWTAVYPADRAVRQIALEIQLLRGRPVHPVWGLTEYLVYSLRHQVLFVLIPMGMILAARDTLALVEGPLRLVFPHLPDLLLGAVAGLVAVTAPLIVRYVWVTQRLPDGPLRDRLLSMCRKLRMRVSEILVWRSGGMIVNAAVMGVVAPLRYVLITDAMIEQMDDTRIEAVFGHEAGHVKRRHILFFLLLAFISGCILTIVSIRVRGLDPVSTQFLVGVAGVVVGAKWLLAFGWISRRFERQADVFGVRALELAGLPCFAPCAVHSPGQIPATERGRAGGAPLCSTAAQVFGSTLNEVAILNGIPPEARSWRHSSIASRSRFIQRLARNPLEAQRFERQVRLIQFSIVVAAVLVGLWAALELQLWRLLLLGFDLRIV